MDLIYQMDSFIYSAFGLQEPVSSKTLATGLINNSFCLTDHVGKKFLLQKVNTGIFSHPGYIQENYQRISQHLKKRKSYKLPDLITTADGSLLLQYKGETWRCFEYMANSYSPVTANTPEESYLVARCFGKFSAGLSDLDPRSLHTILPGFHDLHLRYQQLENALQQAPAQRKKQASALIEQAEKYAYLVKWYDTIVAKEQEFTRHILHQDCKIANILFNKETQQVICPIDIDTTQAGYFFSDIGDMIRSMAPNISENAQELKDMELRSAYYESIRTGYLEAMSECLTPTEIKNIDMAGNLIIYMQALRFLTDYLNNDIYYRTGYPEQNKDRAANQFHLLYLLQQYLKTNRPQLISIAHG